MIRSFYYIKIMFNNYYGISLFNKCMKNMKKLFDIGKMKTSSRLIKNIKSFSR